MRKPSKMATLSRSKDQEKMVAKLRSADRSLQLESITKFNNILSSKRIHLIGEEIRSVVVPRFVEFLEKQDSPKLQYEAVLALTNIAYENVKVVIEHGAVPMLVKLLASPNDDVLGQAIWALSNVVGHSIQCCDHVLSCGALMPLLPHLNEDTKLSIRRTATWTLANLCRGQPPLPFDQVKLVLVALEQVLHTYDEELLRYACWALFHLSYGSEDGIQSVIEACLVPRLVQLLQHTSLFVIVPSLRTIGNIVTGDNQKTQCVINSGALPILANMLTQDYDKRIKRDACWTISNITAGTEEQIQLVIDANLIPTLVNMTQDAEYGIKKEALWAISNATSAGSHDQIKFLVEKSCIKPLCDNLQCKDLRIILACLVGLENILKAGEAEKNTGDHYRQLMKAAQGQALIDLLQSHDHYEISAKALKILETYWPEDEDEDIPLQTPMS